MQEVLGHIPPDCNYQDWLTVLMGLHVHFGGSETGLRLADEWSAQGSKYRSGVAAAKWNSFKVAGGMGWASVCNLARQHGANLSDISRRHSRVASRTPISPLVARQSHSSGQPVSTETDATEFFCAADFSAMPTPTRQWHVPGFLPAGTVTTLGGDGGTGKSLIALQLAVATALGKDWLGQTIKPGLALFISAEDDRDEIHRRIADIVGAEGVRLNSLKNLTLRSLAGKDALLAVPMPTQSELLTETALFQTMEQWIATHRPALVVLDTLADLFGGNEINRSHARQFIGMLRGLALRNGTTVLLLAHPSLTGIASGSGSSGSTAWNNSVRSRVYLRRLKSNGSIETDPDARELEVMKANYGKSGKVLSLRWRDGVFVAERNEGVEGECDPKLLRAKARRVFLTLLKQFTMEGRRVNPSGGNTYAPRAFAGHEGAECCNKAALRAAMNSLLTDGQVIICKEGPPSRLVKFLAIREENPLHPPFTP